MTWCCGVPSKRLPDSPRSPTYPPRRSTARPVWSCFTSAPSDCCTAAELTERYRSFDASDSANQRADDLTPSIDELRRDQRWAIRDLKGESRVTVELI